MLDNPGIRNKTKTFVFVFFIPLRKKKQQNKNNKITSSITPIFINC